MLIQIKEKIPNASGRPPFTGDGVLVGSRYVTHRDGPIDVDDKKASELLKLGLAVAVVELPGARNERAIAPKLEGSRRG